MSIDQYYLSRQKVENYGLVFHLKCIQEAGSSGGGDALLGSVVKTIDQPLQYTYVVPESLIEPRLLVYCLENHRKQLKIQGDIVLRSNVAPYTEKTVITHEQSLQTGIGPFPAIPVSLDFTVDYSHMESLTIEYGAETFYEYIPLGYLGRLHAWLGDRITPETGGRLLRSEAFIVQILKAKNYSVTFESKKKFGVDISAKVAAFNGLPAVKEKVSMEQSSASSLKAKVTGAMHYVVGLTSAIWEDCDLE